MAPSRYQVKGGINPILANLKAPRACQPRAYLPFRHAACIDHARSGYDRQICQTDRVIRERVLPLPDDIDVKRSI
jgi:hypothetical protein